MEENDKLNELNELDAATLYRLAKEKERAEKVAQEAERRARAKELRVLRKETLERHRRELAAIDRELYGESKGVTQTRRTHGPIRRRRKEGPSIGGTLCTIIGEKEEMSIEEIRERATAEGISLSTITQMLAYLKRTGRLTSTRRGFYQVMPGLEIL